MLYTISLASLLATAAAGGSSSSSESATPAGSSCYDIKSAYQSSECCTTDLAKATNFVVSVGNKPPSTPPLVLAAHGAGMNVCHGQNPQWPNWNCTKDGVIQAVEQSGSNVTKGYKGLKATDATPITSSYLNAGLCPVNVHWHLGAEHYSVGQYDEFGSGSHFSHADDHNDDGYSRRRALGEMRQGFQCHHYNSLDKRFTTEYDWKYCTDTHVGETYEVHWPHSAAGMCGTPNQYQTPFYDGVFCNGAAVAQVLAGNIAVEAAIGVQGQVFTIVNDENYYYPDLINGMIIEGTYGADMAYYTGSTTGTSRNNEICSKYGPITWQVDRKCHLISASSFDKLCMDMLSQRDDMSGDTHPHGSRTLVADHLAADNHQRA